MLKKVLAAAMAAVMALALAIPSFAAGGNTANSTELEEKSGAGTISQTVDVVSGMVSTNLKIRFDKGAFVALNPYRMTYSTLATLGVMNDGDAHSSENSSGVFGKSSDTVVSYPVKLQSLTRTAVKVNVTSAKVTIAGNSDTKATIAANPITDVTKAAPKSMFLYVDFESSEYTSGVCTKLFQDYNKSNKFQLALTEEGAAKNEMIKIPAYTGRSSETGATWAVCSGDAKLFGGAANDNFATGAQTLAKMGYSSDSTVIFRIGGQCVANPNNAPWANSDKPTVQLAFSFEPTYN